MPSIQQEARGLYHQSGEPVALGCWRCPEFELCGGLSLASGVHNCTAFCTDNTGDHDHLICPQCNAKEYTAAIREVNGFSLNTVPHPTPSEPYSIPHYIPAVLGRHGRHDLLQTEAAVIPLRRLFHGRSGTPTFQSKQEILSHFKLTPTCSLIVDGVSTDQPLENYWGRARDAGIVKCLRALDITLVTTPNFSLFLNAPRHNDLYNMKRIVTAWAELQSAGVPTSLHINARTDRDYERYAAFILDYPEVHTVSFEFATGARKHDRRRWHVKHLSHLAEAVGRPLRITLRGGWTAAGELSRWFHHVSFIDTSVYMKTMKRFRTEKDTWANTFTLHQQPLDELLQASVDKRSDLFQRSLQKCGISPKGH